MKVFLSYSFEDADIDLARGVERLVSSQDVLVVQGRRLGGRELTPEVRRVIADSDGLIALKTRRDRIGDPAQDRWRSSEWIDYEYQYAIDQGIESIAVVETGVETSGPLQGYERIELDRDEPLQAFLALAETMQRWKARIGLHRVVQIRPDELGISLRNDRNLRCRYRFVREGVRGTWVDTQPIPQPNGTLLYLTGVQDDSTLIEVEILQDQMLRWWSLATSQFISVEMREQAR